MSRQSLARVFGSYRGPASHPHLHIRDAHDAHTLLEAARLQMLPLIQHRLSSQERDMIRPGDVFVWEESEDDGGLLRWTDGRKWSQSRMRGDYLFYEEKIETTREEREEKAARRANKGAPDSSPQSQSARRKSRPNKPDGMTKQTYSALAYLPGHDKPKRWHVVAYFNHNTYTQLPVIADYEHLREIRVPRGLYFSSKVTGTRMSMDDYDDDSSQAYSPRHASFDDEREWSPRSEDFPSSPTLSATSSTDRSGWSSNRHSGPHSNREPRIPAGKMATLTMDRDGRRPGPAYSPLSPEDRRMLSQLRISL